MGRSMGRDEIKDYENAQIKLDLKANRTHYS